MCTTCEILSEILQTVKRSELKIDEQTKLLLKLSSGNQQEIFSVKEAAVFLRLDEQTVSEYCRKGKIKANKTDGGEGVWRITRHALDAFLNLKIAA